MAGKIVAGVDLGGTKIQTAILRNRRIAGTARVLTPQTGSAGVVSAIVATVRDALTEAGLTAADLDAIGIGSPGDIDAGKGTVDNSPNVPGFQGKVRLGPLVSRRMRGAPVFLGNDVAVAVLGEHKRGAGKPFRDILGVWLGTGVGGGLILDNKLREGRGAAGEIGHTIVKDGGRPCSCGRPGHLESYAGRGRMEWAARRMVKKGHKTALFDIMKKKKRTRLSSGVFAEALKKKDRMAAKLIDEAVWALGVALSSAHNLLEVEAIVIGGGLGDRLGKPLIARVTKEMAPRIFVPERTPVVLASELQDLSGAVGAAVLAGG